MVFMDPPLIAIAITTPKTIIRNTMWLVAASIKFDMPIITKLTRISFRPPILS